MRKVTGWLVVVALAAAVGTARAEDDGKGLYDKKCAMCHGVDGVAKPMAKGSRNLNDPSFSMATEEVVTIILEGKGKMPKNAGKITPEQAKLIADYMATLKPKKA